MGGYILFNNPIMNKFTPKKPYIPAFTMKSIFTNNSAVYYKPGSLASGGVGTVINSRSKSRRI